MQKCYETKIILTLTNTIMYSYINLSKKKNVLIHKKIYIVLFVNFL